MSHQDYFKGKKITAMGLGLLGRGVGDIAYMAEAGAAEIIVTDLKTEAELAPSVEQLKQYDNVRFV
ncbi:MAG TPA: UDP-N-acetylmuramoyl-L-alanine--D-glutamate ligase, partial [Candidatus Paceibacterota bacterium]|nr:UDP-N-acetylmuramoyl-L-alanine--D-glutamate ligase [Candidatus Paceibacterota bacterium]